VYILNQAVHHQKRSFEDEYLAMLERHNIAFEGRYVFEQEIVQ